MNNDILNRHLLETYHKNTQYGQRYGMPLLLFQKIHKQLRRAFNSKEIRKDHNYYKYFDLEEKYRVWGTRKHTPYFFSRSIF